MTPEQTIELPSNPNLDGEREDEACKKPGARGVEKDEKAASESPIGH